MSALNVYEISQKYLRSKIQIWDFPGGPVVKNPPSNAGDAGLIPGWGTKSPHGTSTEPARALESVCNY